jgi:hypothetical protein
LIEEKVGIAASIGIPVKTSPWIFTTANVVNPPNDERPAAALPMTISPIKQAVLAMLHVAKTPTEPIEHPIQILHVSRAHSAGGFFATQMKTALVIREPFQRKSNKTCRRQRAD